MAETAIDWNIVGVGFLVGVLVGINLTAMFVLWTQREGR